MIEPLAVYLVCRNYVFSTHIAKEIVYVCKHKAVADASCMEIHKMCDIHSFCTVERKEVL